jgi:hypothetical protein
VREEDRNPFGTLTLVAWVLTPVVDDVLAKAAARRRPRDLEALRKAGEERFKATHGRF